MATSNAPTAAKVRRCRFIACFPALMSRCPVPLHPFGVGSLAKPWSLLSYIMLYLHDPLCSSTSVEFERVSGATKRGEPSVPVEGAE